MGVIPVRLNKEEEKILKELSDNLGVDKSTLIKKSIFELYENLVDMEIIEKFEDKERKGSVDILFKKSLPTSLCQREGSSPSLAKRGKGRFLD